jgi:uncharacterized protein YfaS (alpha-2-macroglobulin family)
MSHKRLQWVGGTSAVLLLLAGFGLLIGRPLVAWGQEGGLPPQVYDTTPLAGEELALDGPVTFYFDQAMDQASVKSAFSVAPEVAGALSWPDDSTLTFTPSGEYDRATEYVFTIGTGATSAQGDALEEAFTLQLRTVGYLEISQVLPADGSEAVETDSVITVIFNRPVVPLVTVEDMSTLPHPLVFDPAVEGQGEWLNTSIYLFTPDKELRGGTDYTVTVKAGLQDVTGGVLEDDYVWHFTTVQPDVVGITPKDGSDAVVLETPITVNFSQAMDPQAVESGGFVLEYLGPFLNEAELKHESVAGQFKWSKDGKTLTFQPDQLLELGGAYQVHVIADKALSSTGAPLREDASSFFTTVPYPEIVKTSPADGEQSAWPYGGFTIYFAGPMNLESLKDKVIIDPKPWRDFDSYYYDWDYSYNLAFDTEPSTEYTITILPGMQDRYGNEIKEGLTVTYTTAAYPPELDIQAPGTVGMYSSYNPSTRVFVTHRNVSRIDLSLWHVSLSRLADLTGPNSWDALNSFTPAPSALLRRWSIDVSSQQDQRRYELLYISDKGPSGISNIECLGAPDPQVKVGDVVKVTREDPRPLNIRQEPNLDARAIAQVLPEETMQIIGGPFCEGGYLWWKVRLDNGITGWAAEGDQSHYYYEPLGTQPSDMNAPNAEAPATYVPEALAPGVYYLEMHSPETDAYDRNTRRHVLLVQSANITLKFSQDTALAWVTDLESGDPVPNVPVIFYNSDFNPVARVTADANGLAVATIPHLSDLYTTVYATVDTGQTFGFAVSNWSDGMDPWQFNVFGDYQPEDFTVYLYTDRPIYRPDQPVYFKGILRNRHDVTYSLPANIKTVPIKVYDDRGEVIYDKELPVTPEGSFSGELQLDPNAPLGYYRIVAEVASNVSDSFSVSFSVAEYRAPEFQVDVTPAESQVVQGDKINVLVEARYFFGGAVSNAQVQYSVLTQDYFFNYTGTERGYWSFIDQNYDFFSPEYYGPQQEVVAEGEGTTDAQGRYMIELTADLGKNARSQTYTIEARVTDESDRLVAGRAQVIVHQGLVYVGLQPQEYIGHAGQETGVNLLTVDWDSQPVSGQQVDYQVVERRWYSVQEQDEMGRTIWTWDVKEEPVEGASGTVTTGADGKAEINFTPPEGGAFKIYATATDERGNEVKSSTFVWVSGSNFVNWRQDNSNRIQLITDKQEYKVGDTAQVLIPSPWQGTAYALITVERGDILKHEVKKLETNSTVYELPIPDGYAPNVYVSVVLVKGVDENNPTAAFRMGVVELPVDTSHLVMHLDVKSNIDVAAGEFAGPGDTVDYTITATDWQGTPVPGAEIGVGLTDLSVLSIAPPNSQELLPFFYSERGVTVRTASPLTVSVDQATQTIIDTIKGGGGGYGEGGIFEVRQNFVDTPLWKPDLITDQNGEATVSVTLPDNLTTWRLDARGVTTGESGPMLVGQTTFDLLSTKPVLIRPGTPRFFVVGDKATLSAIVNNNTNEDLLTEVTLEGTGFTLAEGVTNSQMVNVPAQGRARVNWQIDVLDVPEIDATFYANAGDGKYTDASKPTVSQGQPLPVYKYEVPETVGTAGTLPGPDAGSRTEAIVLPRRYNVTQGELTVRVDRSLAAAMTDSLTWLREYPYYCIEQIISRFLPNAVTVGALHELGLDDPQLKANLDVQVGYALQRLYSEQKPDGGWGWFVQDDSNPVVTAYAVIGLVEARDAGYSVDQAVLTKAVAFVESSLITIRPQDQQWRINRQAFLLYALARADDPQMSRAVRLFDERENMSLYAKAYLAMTFHMLDPKDSRATELINDLSSALVVSATGAHWEESYQDWWNWNTDNRTTALGLMAMTEIDPQNQMLPNIVRGLMVARKADAWETTQETAWAVMALTEWMVTTGELHPDYTFNITLNGTKLEVADNTATPENVKQSEVLQVQVAQLLADQANRLTFSRTAGQGNMYYTAHLRAFLPVPEVEPLDRGIIVSRTYSLLDDPDSKPITSAEVGQSVQVTITIIAPNNLYYLVIEDPIPAGADAVNPNLTTTSQVGTQPQISRERPLSHGWGWWWFSNIEMRDEKVVMYATYLPRGTYEFQYVLEPGLAGEYNVIPTTGFEFYFPEVYGRSAGELFTITGGTPSDAMVPAGQAPAEATPQATQAATAEATAEATETAVPAVDLTSSYTSAGGVRFLYPEGWTVQEDKEQGMTQVANDPAAFSGALKAGQAGVIVFDPGLATTLQAESATDMLSKYVQLVTSQSTSAAFEDVTETTIGDIPAARVSFSEGSAVGIGLVLDLGDGHLVMVFGVAYKGEIAALEPTLLDLAATVTYAPPAQ